MNDPLTIIRDKQLVPMIAIENADHAVPLGEALLAGGLPIVEITFRTAAAADAIKALADRGDLLVGAGTVLTAEQVDQAVDNGASFIVSPGMNPRMVEHALKRNVAVYPGVATPSDIEAALGFGLEVLKFFPAEAMGGTATLKAVGGPYGNVTFIPTGGINPENLMHYLALPNVVACGGSWLARKADIAAGHFDQITEAVRRAVELVDEHNKGI